MIWRRFETQSNRKQPFVICVGDLSNIVIKDVFVMVERKLIRSASLITAVDFCFKIFHVLKLQFPDECFPIWSFFDHCVYQTKEIRTPPKSVLTLGSHIHL